MKNPPWQKPVLDYMAKHGGRITAMEFANLLAFNQRRVRAMFASGLIEGDLLPAQWVSLTGAGWKKARGNVRAL